jgi:hypothetical protein
MPQDEARQNWEMLGGAVQAIRDSGLVKPPPAVLRRLQVWS